MSTVIPRTVLVTGANGYIGNAVARAYVRAGWITYGLIRRETSAKALAEQEIIPIVGSPSDTSFIESLGLVTFDVIVSNTEDKSHFDEHFEAIISMCRRLATLHLASHHSKPLVMFTSGVKDYGETCLDGDPALHPHTEKDPLAPPLPLKSRATRALEIFRYPEDFDGVVVRPTLVFGRTGSIMGSFFSDAKTAALRRSAWLVHGNPRAIIDAIHVDDCGDAYVALASHDKSKVANECFNISLGEYSNLNDIVNKVADLYHIDRVQFAPSPGLDKDPRFLLYSFSQWVDSTKLRQGTGWAPKRGSFLAGLTIYKMAFEAGTPKTEQANG